MDEASKDECTLSHEYGYYCSRYNGRQLYIQRKDLKNLLFQMWWVSQMNAYPSEHSVLVLDNARIHHDKDLIEYIESFGRRVEFLPPYSPNFNPIESSFSVIKSFLQKYRDFVNSCSDPRYSLLIACTQITSNMVAKFFEDSIYM
ncbi:serine/threonine-protein kinase rio2 [Rhizophagus clarus]|uniref:Serine/threonine-protein kinase rio2 n=1 Tax=Rhizophagus clarus TaxID=94130 RepID=A0A8H3QHE5_9GLOM|nr:serine/threonine-protein kinase rio2 [Rhizophagus clarus]